MLSLSLRLKLRLRFYSEEFSLGGDGNFLWSAGNMTEK